MKKFRIGLVITGIGLLSSLLFLVPRQFLGESPGLIPFLGILVFTFGTIILSMSYGDKLSRWLSALVILSLLSLTIPWGGDYTPINIARNLYLFFAVSNIGSWIYLIYLFKSSSNIVH